MNTRVSHRSLTRSLGLAAAGALLLASTACSAEDLADQVAERAIENAAGGEADVDFDSDTGEFKVETDEGTFSSGASLPDDFPSDEVPLLDGEVLQAASSTQDGSAGFVVLIVVDGSVEEALSAASQRLLDAGFAVGEDAVALEGMGLVEVSKGPYSVVASGFETEDGTAINYVVTVK